MQTFCLIYYLLVASLVCALDNSESSGRIGMKILGQVNTMTVVKND